MVTRPGDAGRQIEPRGKGVNGVEDDLGEGLADRRAVRQDQGAAASERRVADDVDVDQRARAATGRDQKSCTCRKKP